jgi:hypothetical protein
MLKVVSLMKRNQTYSLLTSGVNMLDIINNYAMAVCNVNWYTITVSLLVLQYLYIHKMVV